MLINAARLDVCNLTMFGKTPDTHRTVISLTSQVVCMHDFIETKMCCAGAPCRQLWVTVDAWSCRERGAFSDFPISPSRVRGPASTSRPTANLHDDHCAPTQRSLKQNRQCRRNHAETRTRWVHRHNCGRGVFAHTRPDEREPHRSLFQPGRASDRRVA